MAELNDDLWPNDFGTSDSVPPVAILRKQASALYRKTNYVLSAQVETHNSGSTIYHLLYVIAAPLDNYKYEILRVSHEPVFYPLHIRCDDANLYDKLIKTEQEFTSILRTIFASEKVKRVINSLLAQSQTG
jgi:hypothetical protein